MPNSELNKFEKIVIILALIIGFLGGTILVFIPETPAMLISILLAIGIATLVYHFLGGIENAQLNTGAIKLGGSMAALFAGILIINPQLDKQLNSNYKNITSKYTDYSYNLSLDKNLNVIARDSIRLGKLTFNDLTISNKFEIISNDTIILGDIKKQDLFDLGGLNKLEVKNYTEIKFNTHLANPFDYQIDESTWDDVNGYRGIYNALPFEIKPYKIDRSFKTKFLFDDGTEKSSSITRNESTFISNISENEIHIFIIRIRQVSESLPWDTFDNFVQYQILEFVGYLELK